MLDLQLDLPSYFLLLEEGYCCSLPDVGSQATTVAFDALEVGLTSAVGTNAVPGVDRWLLGKLNERTLVRAEARTDGDSTVVLGDACRQIPGRSDTSP